MAHLDGLKLPPLFPWHLATRRGPTTKRLAPRWEIYALFGAGNSGGTTGAGAQVLALEVPFRPVVRRGAHVHALARRLALLENRRTRHEGGLVMRSSSHVASLAFTMTLVSLALEPGVGSPARAQSAVSANGLVESTSGGFKFPDGTIQATAAASGSAPVEDTGQVDCWDTTGTPIVCAGSGQDGEILAGVAWPTPRFTDNSDGTVTDNLTGLIWLQDANCFGVRTWANALTDATGLASGFCGLSDSSAAGDWRLPNVNELTSLVDYGAGDPAIPPGHPFTSVQSLTYWSSSTNFTDEEYAWIIFMFSGGGNHSLKTEMNYVWPVRGGHE